MPELLLLRFLLLLKNIFSRGLLQTVDVKLLRVITRLSHNLVCLQPFSEIIPPQRPMPCLAAIAGVAQMDLFQLCNGWYNWDGRRGRLPNALA